MEDYLGLVVATAREQGFSVSRTGNDQSVLGFHKDGDTYLVPEPNSAVDYMELRRRLVEMGMIWPFPPNES
jgi:hypothetical protein